MIQKTAYKSTNSKGMASYSQGSLIVDQTLVLQIMFCGKNPATSPSCKTLAVMVQSSYRLTLRTGIQYLAFHKTKSINHANQFYNYVITLL